MPIPTDELKFRVDSLMSFAGQWSSVFSDTHRGHMLTIFIGFVTSLTNLINNYDAFKTDKNRGNYYVHRAINQIEEEWDVISRLCFQHLALSNTALAAGTGDILKKAERQALAYYDAFHGYKSAVVPFVFFDTSARINHHFLVPYPIIGVPYHYFEQDLAYQALAHEIGHHVYSHSSSQMVFASAPQLLERVVREMLEASGQKSTVETTLNWIEELFADVCGVLLAGPSFVDTAINLCWMQILRPDGMNKSKLLEHDNKHPAYYVRPLIGLATLQWLIEKYPTHKNVEKLKEFVKNRRTFWEQKVMQTLEATPERIANVASQNLEPVPLGDDVVGVVANPSIPIEDVDEQRNAVESAVWLILEGHPEYGSSWEAPLDQKPPSSIIGLGGLFDHSPILSVLDNVSEINNDTVVPTPPSAEDEQPRPTPDYGFEQQIALFEELSKMKRDTVGFIESLIDLLRSNSNVAELFLGQTTTGLPITLKWVGWGKGNYCPTGKWVNEIREFIFTLGGNYQRQ